MCERWISSDSIRVVAAEFLETVGRTYMAFKQADAALPWFQRVVELHRDVLASDARTRSLSLERLASALTRVGENDEARQAYLDAIQLMRKAVNAPDAELAGLLESYSHFVGYRMGDLQSGLKYRKESLAMIRALDPPDERLLAVTLDTMGGFVHDMARFPDAERYYIEARQLYERLGLEERSRGIAHALGLLYKDMGRYDEAETLIRALVDESKARFGKDDVAMGTLYLSLAKLYADMNQPALALPPCQTAIELYAKQYGEDHETTSEPITLMGRILLLQQRFVEAEPVLRNAFKTRERVFARTNWERAKTATLVGAALAGMDRFEEAEPLLLENYGYIRDNRGPSHRRTTEALERVVFLYERWAKPQEAKRWHQEPRETASPLWTPAMLITRDHK